MFEIPLDESSFRTLPYKVRLQMLEDTTLKNSQRTLLNYWHLSAVHQEDADIFEITEDMPDELVELLTLPKGHPFAQYEEEDEVIETNVESRINGIINGMLK